MSAQLSFDDDLPERAQPRTLSHNGGDGCARLMRALVRAGLPEDAWLSAASFVLQLDSEAAAER